MDPINQMPEEHGHDDDIPGGGRAARGAFDARGDDPGGAGPPWDALPPDSGGPAPSRVVQVVSGDFLLTVNPVDGSEIEPCPPGQLPPRPRRQTSAERAERRRAALPPAPPNGVAGLGAEPPLLERGEERERLARLLARGRSVRLTGPAGSGRTSLIDAVAKDCADLAPDGVIRLSGHRRGATDLLFELYAAVFTADGYRPDRAELLELVGGIGAVVVVDDLEFGAAALDEVLAATPECAFLFAATPDVPAPSSDSHIEEVFLGGLSRGGGLELLARCVDRALTEDEASWAGDLWFESEGLPLRFVQAGALLLQRDRQLADPDADGADGADGADDGSAVPPLPTLAEGAAPAELLASRLSESARAALRFAVALGGEVPHQAHLPALVGDTHADAALGELAGVALVTPVGSGYRLAAGVRAQLTAAGYGDDAAERAHTAAQHYAWWAGHPSVTPRRAVAEADAILAALTAQVSGGDSGQPSCAVLLARTAAPAFAAGLGWSAWERALRTGLEAARRAGEVAEEAYFHHDLGILALLGGQLDRARAELEASIGMRGVLADKRGTVAGRRALALVADRSGGVVYGGRTPAGEEVPAARYDASASPLGGMVGTPATGTPSPGPLTPGVPASGIPASGVPRPGTPAPGIPAALSLPEPPNEKTDETLVSRAPSPVFGGGRPAMAGTRRTFLTGARRNLVAGGAGALLVAVLGTVVTLGATSGEEPPANTVKPNPSASQDSGDDGRPADPSAKAPGSTTVTSHPGGGGVPGVVQGTDEPGGHTGEPSGDPSTSPDTSETPDPSASGSQPTSPDPTRPDPTWPEPTNPDPGGGDPTDPDPTDSDPATDDPEPEPSDADPTDPEPTTQEPDPEPEPTTEQPPEETTPGTTTSASAPTSTAPASSSAPASGDGPEDSPTASDSVI
ncbi:ATP-binding protein [Streptomyces sp. O3]